MAIEKVKFLAHTIYIIVTDDGQKYIPLRPVCETIGLNWVSQLDRTKAHKVLGGRLQEFTIPVGRRGRGQSDRKMVCIALDKFDFWLATINADRYRNEATEERLLLFQAKCAQVLYAHFRGGPQVAGNVDRPTLVQGDFFDTSATRIRDLETALAERDGQINELEARAIRQDQQIGDQKLQLGALIERQVPNNVVEQERQIVELLRANAELKERIRTMVPRPKLAEPRKTQPRDPREVIFDD